MKQQLQGVENLILSEVNVKEINYLNADNGVLIKKIKPNFKALGPRYGKLMKEIALVLEGYSQFDIRSLEVNGTQNIDVAGQSIELTREDVEITTDDIPGWTVVAQDKLTVALDITLTDALIQEGLVRELVNRVQNMRKDAGLEVTDHILLEVQASEKVIAAIQKFEAYICSETLGILQIVAAHVDLDMVENELVENITANIRITKAK